MLFNAHNEIIFFHSHPIILYYFRTRVTSNNIYEFYAFKIPHNKCANIHEELHLF